MENLDRLCAENGHKFAEEITKKFEDSGDGKAANKAENLLTKALGVLQEQGVYAFVLFCKSRGSAEKRGAEEIEKTTKEILKDKLKLIANGELLEEIRKENGLASKFEALILATQVLEKSLIYARYHAKAMSNS